MEETVIRLRRRAGKEQPPQGQIVVEEIIDLDDGERVRLKLSAEGDKYAFAYASGNDAYRTLYDNADGKILSTYVAGGFTGVLLGMYAETD